VFQKELPSKFPEIEDSPSSDCVFYHVLCVILPITCLTNMSCICVLGILFYVLFPVSWVMCHMPCVLYFVSYVQSRVPYNVLCVFRQVSGNL